MFPFLKTLFADSGYQGPKFAKALAKILPHLDIEIVKRSDQVSGFVDLPQTLDIGAIPIGDDDQLIGVVTDLDIVWRVGAGQLRCSRRDGTRCDDHRHPLLPGGR
jgi:CBS domain-containing protein